MIRNEQDLLEKYYRSEITVIGEYSAKISEDTDELKKEVQDYANTNNLDSSFIKKV